MSFRKTLIYTKNKTSDAFSRDSNYEFDCMLRIKGQVLKKVANCNYLSTISPTY